MIAMHMRRLVQAVEDGRYLGGPPEQQLARASMQGAIWALGGHNAHEAAPLGEVFMYLFALWVSRGAP